MKKVLVLGAGLVSRPLVRYLLKRKGISVTVASRTLSKAEALVEDKENGTALQLNVKNDEELEKLVSEHDLSVSLLPYVYHPKVAKMCIEHKKNMVTTSYVSDAMRNLDKEAQNAGITILNEIGVDPGIDHMSAMQVIHNAENRGGTVVSFRSYCGGLPAPEANDNPLGYKFSWSPKGVLMAGKNDARYMENGSIIEIEGKDLFDNYWAIEIPGAGIMETYPNRNSLIYIDLYGLGNVRTMLRGTLRNTGWCKTLKRFVDIGLLSDIENESYRGMEYADFIADLLNINKEEDMVKRVAHRLHLDEESVEIEAMKWLGLMSNEKIPEDVNPAPIDIMTDLMLRKMSYKEGERDMLVMHHHFNVEFENHKEEIKATMIDYGIPHGDSSMSRTVSLPCAIGARLVLEGEIDRKGVIIPVTPDIYDPVMNELETMGIKFTETRKTL